MIIQTKILIIIVFRQISVTSMQVNKKNFDSELQTYFGMIKRNIKGEHVDYLKSHPQLRQILNDFLSSCLLQQPDNVYTYASKYFAYFNYQKDKPRFKPLVISGCSGVGKSTVISKLIEKYGDIFELSISYTTRRPRQGQMHGRQYYFVNKQEFEKQIAKNVFAEYLQINGNYYGTHLGKLNDIINRGKICLLDIDLNGGQKIHSSNEQCNFLFIDAPSLQVLQQRLKDRGTQDQEVIQRIMKHSEEQLERMKQIKYYERIVNSQLDDTIKKIVQYVEHKYDRKIDIEK